MLDTLARSLIAEGVAPAVSLGFARRTAAGWQLAKGGATDAYFDLASLTKPMTALAVVATKLERTTPLGDLLIEARGTPSAAATVEALLAHRAGLEANHPLYAGCALPLAGACLDRGVAIHTVAAARRATCIGAIPSDGFPPIYSDLGYVLVGEALARRENARDAGEVIEQSVARHLELGTARTLRQRTDFAARVVPTEVTDLRGGEVRGVVHDENAWALTGDGASGHAGMFGTIDGVLRFATSVLDRRSEIDWLLRERSGGTLRAGFDGKSREGSTAGDRLSPRAFGHLGFTGTSFWIDPDRAIVVALLTNRVHPTRENQAIRAARPRVHDALFAAAVGDACE